MFFKQKTERGGKKTICARMPPLWSLKLFHSVDACSKKGKIETNGVGGVYFAEIGS